MKIVNREGDNKVIKRELSREYSEFSERDSQESEAH
jgi:hypothetical protein